MNIKHTNTGRRFGMRWAMAAALALVGLVTIFGHGSDARADGSTNGTFAFSLASGSVTEGQTACIYISRAGGTAGIQNVQYSLAFGGAATPADLNGFNPISGYVTFPAGSSASESIDAGPHGSCITTLDDGASQAARTVTFTLTPGGVIGGGVLGAQTTFILTILDNDGPPTYSLGIATFSVAENAGTLTIPISRSGIKTATDTVHCVISLGGGNPAQLGDITGTTLDQLITFAPTVTTQNCTITIVNDLTLESPNETLAVTLNNPSGGFGAGATTAGTVTIVDDDGPGTLQFSSPTFSVVEAITTASATVSRINGQNGAASIQCSTVVAGSTATVVSDYTAVTNQVLNWADQDAAPKTCVIPILDDILVEGPETVNLQLTSPAGATAGAQQTAVLTIIDNDGAGVVQFLSATYTGAENSGAAVVTLTRSGSTVGQISVDCRTLAGGTATANVDYTAGSFTATFLNGSSTATCSIPLIDDVLVEGPETILLDLTNLVGGGSVGGQTTATLTIGDNETAIPTITFVSPGSGPTLGGTLVTITGTNFTGATGVAFGVNLAVFIVDNDNQIRVTAPAHIAGLVEVVVTTSTGSNTTFGTANDYTYTDGPTITSLDIITGPASGSPLTFVTITGTGFVVGGSGMTVKFGGTPATAFTVYSTTSISAILPAHAAGLVDVVVTTPAGTTPNTVNDDFTYTGSSAPVVTAVSPGSGPVGTSVTITGSGFTGVSCPSGVTFGGVVSTSCSVSTDSQITATVPASAPSGVIDIRVTGPGGTSANTVADNFTNTSAGATITYSLSFRFTLIGWTGKDGISAAAALSGVETPVDNPATNNVSSIVTAIWQFDTGAQAYRGYFPGSEGVPGANDFTTLRKGVGYFIAINTSSANWTVIEG